MIIVKELIYNRLVLSCLNKKCYKQHFLFILFVTIITFSKVEAQQNNEQVQVCGDYAYPIPRNMTMEQAEMKALELARANAIAKYFGFNVSKDVIVTGEEKNGQYEDNIYIYGTSREKGEWLQTIGKPEITIATENNTTILKVMICGWAKKIVNQEVEINYKILKNGTDENKFESEDFKEEDQIYIYFTVPIDGYLSIFLIDDSEKNAFCLLPYGKDKKGSVKVSGGKKYILFSDKHVDQSELSIIEEYTMSCDKKQTEHNQLYIIFSPNEFIKPNTKKSELAPRELSFDDFQNWLTNNRLNDEKMQVKQTTLTIKKK